MPASSESLSRFRLKQLATGLALLVLYVSALWAQGRFAEIKDPDARMAAKLDFIAENGRRDQPDQSPTELTAEEVEAYFASGRLALPAGVSGLRYRSTPGRLTAFARVDFDEVTRERRTASPWLVLFTGVHDVEVAARAEGSGGRARVHIETVTFNGVQVPRRALEWFIDRYVRPRYPEAGLDMQFQMPARVDLAQFGNDTLILTQK